MSGVHEVVGLVVAQVEAADYEEAKEGGKEEKPPRQKEKGSGRKGAESGHHGREDPAKRGARTGIRERTRTTTIPVATPMTAPPMTSKG